MTQNEPLQQILACKLLQINIVFLKNQFSITKQNSQVYPYFLTPILATLLLLLSTTPKPPHTRYVSVFNTCPNRK